VLLLTSIALLGCDDFLSVDNPTVIDGATIDPVQDGEMFSWSAFQNFVASFGNLTLWSAIFTGEMWVDDSGPGPGEFGRREIGPFTGNGQWTLLSRAVATSEQSIELLRPAGGTNLARVLLASGNALQLMADVFCDGVIRGGPLLTTEQLIDLVVQRFDELVAVAGTLQGNDRTRYLGAAHVGLARAHLQAGRRAEAIAAATAVPDGFTFMIITVSDPANRSRLGNAVYDQMVERASQTVPPSYRAYADAGDTRITYRDAQRRAQGGQLFLYEQQKYADWASPYRLASKLEARYLEEEAKLDPVSMLAFINERRAVGAQDPLTDDSLPLLIRELMDQKSRDFWLEGAKRHGDWRRNPGTVPNILPAGSANYEPTEPPIGNQTCFPIPATERDRNPNF
jgi:hypothetical protein